MAGNIASEGEPLQMLGNNPEDDGSPHGWLHAGEAAAIPSSR